MRYLVESYQKQVAEGLDPKQVKFMSSLPALRDASVAGIVEVYDFMAGLEGQEMVKKVLKVFLTIFSSLNYYRLGGNALRTIGTSLPNV